VNARRPTWQTIREWIPSDDAEPCADLFDQRTESGNPVELRRKTAPSSSAIPTEATESAAPENPLPEKARHGGSDQDSPDQRLSA